MKKDKNFVKLQKEWYKKIKEEGFQDIEYFNSEGEPEDMMRGSSKFTSAEVCTQIEDEGNRLLYDTTYAYYYDALVKSIELTFESEVDKTVFFYHSQGLSLRQIARKVGFSHPKVLRILNKYKSM